MNSELLKEVYGASRVSLGDCIEIFDTRGGAIDRNEVEGVSISKAFVPTVANLENAELSKYKHVGSS